MKWNKIENLDLSFKPDKFRTDTLIGRYVLLVDKDLHGDSTNTDLTVAPDDLYCRMFENGDIFPDYQKDYFGNGRGVIKKNKEGNILVYFFESFWLYKVKAFIPLDDMLNEYKNL